MQMIKSCHDFANTTAAQKYYDLIGSFYSKLNINMSAIFNIGAHKWNLTEMSNVVSKPGPIDDI